MLCAATSMASRSLLMSRSLESATPIPSSCSRRRNRSPESGGSIWFMAIGGLLDADRAHLLDVGDSHQDLFDAVLLQGAHAGLERGRQHLRNPGVLLDVLL